MMADIIVILLLIEKPIILIEVIEWRYKLKIL